MNLDNINKRNTREWSMANENSKAEAFRNAVVNKHGGIHPDGKEEIVENLSKFCRKHSLNKAAMYEVYNGKRNHHKNFKLKKQGD